MARTSGFAVARQERRIACHRSSHHGTTPDPIRSGRQFATAVSAPVHRRPVRVRVRRVAAVTILVLVGEVVSDPTTYLTPDDRDFWRFYARSTG
ncbi:MAG: hypothetical protein JOY58_03690 [Solirubrobacterales bacterium]|nr:hypothetical protein [Solirubrobacterales bacterium]